MKIKIYLKKNEENFDQKEQSKVSKSGGMRKYTLGKQMAIIKESLLKRK